MSKWKWIAQDLDGGIYKFDIEPKMYDAWGFLNVHNRGVKLIKEGKPNPNFKETLINLETEDYEINDGILLGIPRKTHLDKLIANVKKIDKKAAKWMNKNRYKLEDTKYLDCCFTWRNYEKFNWIDINEKLEEMAEQQPEKETLKYRVSLHSDMSGRYPKISTSQEDEIAISRYVSFRGWLTDWIEVQA
jgi:hypothetical protein